MGLATFLLGDVTNFSRYASPNTDARERQWRHFYYAQDTWRPTPKLTLNYGLRLDVINPQTVNEAGNGGWLDLNTGEILIGGVGDVNLAGNVKNRLNWAPRVGATYQINEKTVIRGGYGRTLRHRRVRLAVRTQRDAEPAGVVGAADERAHPTSTVCSPWTRVRTRRRSRPRTTGRFPLKNGVFTRALPPKQRPPAVDAYNVTVQRQLTDVMSIEVGYVGNYGAHQFVGDGPDVERQRAHPRGVPGRPARPAAAVLRRPVPDHRRRIRRSLRLDAGHRLLLQLRAQLVQLDADAPQPALQGRLLVPVELHPAEGRTGRRVVLLLRQEPEQGADRAGTGRTP